MNQFGGGGNFCWSKEEFDEKKPKWVSLINIKQNQIKLLYEYSEVKSVSRNYQLPCSGDHFDLFVTHNVMLQVIASLIRDPKSH